MAWTDIARRQHMRNGACNPSDLRDGESALLTTINHLLVMTARQHSGREASPTAGVIDSQSVKTTDSG